MRLAWFTPWPPQPSGIAGRSQEVTALLAARGFGIDICVDERRIRSLAPLPDEAVEPGQIRVQSAHDFVWRHFRGQYDLIVYQVGNSRHHDAIWPYLFRWPGLVVLHDARLHHARGRTLLRKGGPDAYRAELAFNHPNLQSDAAELAISGFDGRYYAMWPMTRAVVASARAVAVHARGTAAALAEEYPDCPISYLPLGSGRLDPVPGDRRSATRLAHGVSPETVLYGAFGGLTADKRIPEVLRAFADLRRRHPSVALWLAGAPDRGLALPRLLEDLGIADVTTLLPDLDDEAFEEAIAAVDVSLNLRWPTALETSGPWLQALALAKPTITMELAHQAHVPSLDPRDWQPRDRVSGRAPVTVAIDILDEHHSLVLAMDRLAGDAAFREQLGQAARTYWECEHTPAVMADGYAALLADAATRPAPAVQLPAALRADVGEPARRLIATFGLEQCELL